MTFATTDLCDAHEDKLTAGMLAVLPPVFMSFGRVKKFCGPAATLKVFEDNALVRSALETQGSGRVLVVDGGGSMRCALVGGNLGLLAQKNGWAGIIVNGCIRDSAEINACDIGIRALALHPQKSVKKGVGDVEIKVSIGGVPIRPGDWVYADEDGVLIAHEKLA